ncbi:MAG: type II secretion system minor pseudopilin GspK [Ideonella sp.]|nr:type II secretion system minor pseudopilin GspK [Ideonella sp.]
MTRGLSRLASRPERPALAAVGRRPRGAALLTAMIIVALVATLATSIVWQQYRAVQVEAAERARAQSAWILSGALDWARIILREDARTGGADHLGEPWATPLAEARLSTFLAADEANTDGAPEAFLAGAITDAQARYNLRNLVDNGQVVPAELATLQRLCEAAGVPAEAAQRIAAGLRDAWGGAAAGTSASPNPPVAPQSVAQLRWFGVDPPALERLAPMLVLLPNRTTVNLNTASREVIAAAVEGLDLASAERLVQARSRTPFKSVDDARRLLGEGAAIDARRVGVASSYFEVTGRLRVFDRVLEERSIVERRGLDMVPIQRERLTMNEQAFGPR